MLPLIRLTLCIALAVSSAALAGAARAQTEPAASSVASPGASQTIEIRGERRRRRVAGADEPGAVLSGAALADRSSGTLGATLQDEPGVANASFGPGVGLPQIRGQGGTRVRVLLGGMGSNDASAVSADHAVMAEPALARRITVFRGPSAILHGGSAIGGAVRIDEERIPEFDPERPEVDLELRAGRDSSLAVFRAAASLGGGWVAYGDGHRRDTRRVRIPGLALDEDAIRAQFGLVNGRNTQGFVGNSDARSEGGALALSRVSESGYMGLGWQTLSSGYGLPPGAHTHGPEKVAQGLVPDADADVVRIAAKSQRLQWKSEWNLVKPDNREKARVRAGWLDWLATLRLEATRSLYAHDELEAGLVGTRFQHRVSEARLELDTRGPGLMSGMSGMLGAQLQSRDFSALGLEAFVPRAQIEVASLFGLQRWTSGPWSAEIGLRTERHAYEPDTPFVVLGLSRDLPPRRFWPRSGSMQLRHSHDSGALTLTHWRVARAPDVQEIYAGGPHIATRSFDFGNTALDIETLTGTDLGLEQQVGGWRWRGNAFVYRSAGYIYQRNLGWFYEAEEQQAQALCTRLDNCLPATKYEQQGARFWGYEVEGRRALPAWNAVFRVFSDAVRGRLQAGEDVPRLAPQRYGVALEYAHGRWRSEWRLTRARAQTRPGPLETPTADWLQLNGSLRYSLERAQGTQWSLFVVGRNLGNAQVRNSASFLRNYAPEPGRLVQIGLQATL